MEAWNLAVFAGMLIAYAVLSTRLQSTVISSAIVYVTIGALVGPAGTGWIEAELNGGELLRTVAEITLTFVLFTDASRIDLRALRRQVSLPARLLGIGLPLTILGGMLVAKLVWPDLPWIEAAVLAVILAPTDAALGQAVVTDPRLPQRISQGLNVESGLNDGICVPVLVILLAVAGTEAGSFSGAHAVRVVCEEIGYGIVGGVLAGLIGVAAIHVGSRKYRMSLEWRNIAGLATAGLAYGIAAPLGGSGFIAAFVGGLVFGWLRSRIGDDWNRLIEGAGQVLNALTFFAFGAAVLGPLLDDLDWRIVLYAACSLTLVRAIPVAIAMIGSRAHWKTVAFLAWFGPRGLASIVFVVIAVSDGVIANAQLVTVVAAATIGLSVVAHGITAVPLTERYCRWHAKRPQRPALMEHAEVEPHPPRWQIKSSTPSLE